MFVFCVIIGQTCVKSALVIFKVTYQHDRGKIKETKTNETGGRREDKYNQRGQEEKSLD